ncbi:chromatin accessibility complex protein 1 [Anoplophora glabripennis]|uniref:chromatin accessibility complex protein 1 n=1 Tax=Anoplophora glabripennis TaxID=217634 RepID=UPI000873E203|nr:chromatin accessibility complex protein 1 [Anoplophora glabripennis]
MVPVPKTHLPATRISTIMKSSSDVEMVNKESIFLMCRAAELFIKHLATESYNTTGNGKKLDYKNLAQIVHSDDKYEFLRDIMPKKITVREFKRLMAKKQAEEGGKKDDKMSSSSEDDDSSSSTSSGDDDSSSESEESNASA